MDAAKFSCGMTIKEFTPIFKEFEDDGGCRVETYMDLFNYLQDYRKTKLSNGDLLSHEDIVGAIGDVNPA